MEAKFLEQNCYFTTERLIVRGWNHKLSGYIGEDAFVKRVMNILSPEVTKALPDGWQHINTVETAKNWINERNNDSNFLTIEYKETGDVIGFIFLYESELKDSVYQLRFGYLLSKEFWGKGLGTELVKGLVGWCKALGTISSLSGGVERDNMGSIKVLKKAGFLPSAIDNHTEAVVFYEYRFDVRI